MPTVKTDSSGQPYYAQGAGDKVAGFVQSFMQTLQGGLELGSRKRAEDREVISQKMQLRLQYNQMNPNEQKRFVETQPEDVLDFLGLMEATPEGDKPVAKPQATGQTTKAPKAEKAPKLRIRKDAVRDWTDEEKAREKQSQAIVETAVPLARQAVETGEVQLAAIKQNMKIGQWDFETRKTDKATQDALKASDDPFLKSLGYDKPVDQFILEKLTKDYPDMADRIMQQKFDIGPAARNAAVVRETQAAMQQFGNVSDAKKYAAAIVQAQYEGKYDLMNALPQAMKTLGVKQLEQGWARIELDKKQMIQSEAQFKLNGVNHLMQVSGYSMNSDTAGQLMSHVMYGAKLSDGAAEQYKGFIKIAQDRQQLEGENLFSQTMMNRGKAAQEGIASVRETISTLLAQRKAIGKDKSLDASIEALSDKLVEVVGKQMGLEPAVAQTPVWKAAIVGAAKTMFGVTELGARAAADKADLETSFAGDVVTDALGPQIIGLMKNAKDTVMGKIGEATEAGQMGERVLTDPEGLSVDFALSGTALGNRFKEISEKTPGLRIIFQRNLTDYGERLLSEAKANTNPARAEVLRDKIRAIKEVLQGMGVK